MTHQGFSNIVGPGGPQPISAICPGRVHVVAVAVGANSTAAFADSTTVVRIVSTVDCYYVGSWMAAAATSNDNLLLAGVIEYVNVTKGSTISIIRSAGDGTARVSEAI